MRKNKKKKTIDLRHGVFGELKRKERKRKRKPRENLYLVGDQLIAAAADTSLLFFSNRYFLFCKCCG